MANVVITTGAKQIKFEMNEYSVAAGFSYVLISKNSVANISLKTTHIEIMKTEGTMIPIHYDTNSMNASIIDSIDGTTFASLQALFNKFEAVLNV